MIRLVTLFTLILVILAANAVLAQSQDHPLMELMAYTADTAENRRSFIHFLDFRAVENARSYLTRPPNAQIFWFFNPSLSFTFRWLAAPPEAVMYFNQETTTRLPEVMGFDFFALNRTLYFGNPPQNGIVWSGDFDPDSIRNAHAARGYAQTEIGGIEAWCGEVGCDNGTLLNLNARDRANLFDPVFGRAVPFLVPNEQTLVSSPSLQVLQAAAAAHAQGRSLAAVPDYRALVLAITDESVYAGELVNAIFMPALDVMEAVPDVAQLLALNPNLSAEQRLELINQRPAYLREYSPLPPYLNVVLADRQEGALQVAILALAYPSAEAASAAASELERRLMTFGDAISQNNPDAEPILGRFLGQASRRSRVQTDVTSGISVAVVEIWYPAAPPDEERNAMSMSSATGGLPARPAALARWIYESVVLRGFYPLWAF